MSLSPSKHFFIALCPDRIGVVLRSGRWRRTTLQREAPVSQEVAAHAGWQSALDVLERWFESEGAQGGRATLTVSNRWVRFALAPWSNAVGGEKEEAALAQACLESTYGDMTGWRVALGPARHGQARMVCAMESAFLDRLRELLQRRRIECCSVYPYFMHSRRWGGKLFAAPLSLLAVAESDTVVLAATRQGRRSSLRSVRCELTPLALMQLMRREALLQGFGETPLFGVLAPGMAQADLPGATLLRSHAAASGALAMASEAVTLPGRMRIDFMARAWSPGKVFGIFALLLALAAATVVGWRYAQLQESLDGWQADWQRLHRSDVKPRATISPEEQERLKAELRFANRVIDRLDTPWDRLFEAIESAFNEQATLLSIEPDTERQEVRLVAEAKDLTTMLDYVRQVRQAAALKQVYLADHQISLQDPLRPVRFTVMAHWRVEPEDIPERSGAPDDSTSPGNAEHQTIAPPKMPAAAPAKAGGV